MNTHKRKMMNGANTKISRSLLFSRLLACFLSFVTIHIPSFPYFPLIILHLHPFVNIFFNFSLIFFYQTLISIVFTRLITAIFFGLLCGFCSPIVICLCCYVSYTYTSYQQNWFKYLHACYKLHTACHPQQ